MRIDLINAAGVFGFPALVAACGELERPTATESSGFACALERCRSMRDSADEVLNASLLPQLRSALDLRRTE